MKLPPDSGPASDITFRPATLDDLETIVHHRRSMFFDMGHRDHAVLDGMCVRFRPWLRAKMEANQYLAWFAATPSGGVAAGLGVWLMDWPPHMFGAGPWRANILNVYTESAHRRRGLARHLMRIAMDWCTEQNITAVILHASDEGRSLYESLGFRPTNEMRLTRSD